MLGKTIRYNQGSTTTFTTFNQNHTRVGLDLPLWGRLDRKISRKNLRTCQSSCFLVQNKQWAPFLPLFTRFLAIARWKPLGEKWWARMHYFGGPCLFLFFFSQTNNNTEKVELSRV